MKGMYWNFCFENARVSLTKTILKALVEVSKYPGQAPPLIQWLIDDSTTVYDTSKCCTPCRARHCWVFHVWGMRGSNGSFSTFAYEATRRNSNFRLCCFRFTDRLLRLTKWLHCLHPRGYWNIKYFAYHAGPTLQRRKWATPLLTK